MSDLARRADRPSATGRTGALSRPTQAPCTGSAGCTVPALGARSVPRRAMRAVVSLVEGLCSGEEVVLGGDARRRGGAAHRDAPAPRRASASPPGSDLPGTDVDRDDRVRRARRCGATCGCSSAWSAPNAAGARHRAPVERAGPCAHSGTAAYAMSPSSMWMLSHPAWRGRVPPSSARRRSSRCAWSWCSRTACGAGVRAGRPPGRRPLQPHDVRDSGACGPHALRQPARHSVS